MGHWKPRGQGIKQKISREEKNTEKKNKLNVPPDFQLEVSRAAGFHGKNECPSHETGTATSTPSLNKEGTQAQPGNRKFCTRGSRWFTTL